MTKHHPNIATVNDGSNGHGPVRPHPETGASTRRDIHISEQGQHLAPSGPTRIATWRPIPGKSIPKKEFTPNEQQAAMIQQLKEYTEEHLMLKEGDPLFEEYGYWEKRFLDKKDTYSRYMRAADWKMDNAKKRIKETLEWRRKYQPDLIKPEEIRVEAEGGKVVVNGFDRDGRPIVWLRPSRENTKPSPTQIRHLIFQLERAIDLCPEGVEKLALVVDYKGATSSNNPSMKTVKEVIYILQNHYVERLGKGVVVNVPFYLQAFFNMIKPLLDPKTKQKVQFNPPLKKLIPSQQLDAEFKGDYQYIYDSNVYLPAICHFCGIKEDGTREEIIPKDIPMSKPDEIQRSLTQNTGNTAEEEAEIARREAEAQERQDREAEKYEETGGEAPVLDGDDDDDDGDEDVNHENGQGQQLGQKDDIEYKNGGKYDAAAVVAAAAAASAAGGAAGATTLHDPKSEEMRSSETSATPARDTSAPTTAAASTTLGKDSKAEMHPNPPSATANTKPATAQSSALATAAPTKNTKTLSSASQDSTRKRGGWKLFSSKRGLDKEGNPTSHAHKHVIKALCMHKGAISPSKNPSEDQKKVPEKTDTATPDATLAAGPEATAASGAADGRVKIAPEATAGREERTYNNAPLATNATFGPDAYHTAMEAYPTTSDPNLEGSGGDYFTNLKKIPPVKPSLVDDEHQDKAKLVERPTEIMNRLHEGGTGELTLAFEVKQPPVWEEEEVGQAPTGTGESAKAAA